MSAVRAPGPREAMVKPDLCPTALMLAWMREVNALRDLVTQQAAALAALDQRVTALE